jgi:hypothetical protein
MNPYDELIERMRDSDFEVDMRKYDEINRGLSEAHKFKLRQSMVEETLRNDDRSDDDGNNYDY